MENYEESIKIDYNPNWLYIPDHHYRTLIIGGSGSGKTVLLNLMKYQRPDTDKINICYKSNEIKVSIAFWYKRKCRDWKNKKSRSIYWSSTNNW